MVWVERALRILSLLLRVAACAPLTVLFLPFLLHVLSWWGRDPLGWLDPAGLLLTALAFGGLYGLVGLWVALFFEGAPKSRRLRRALAGGLVVGMAAVAPFCLGLGGPLLRDFEGFFPYWVFLGPVVVAVYQLVQLLREPTLPPEHPAGPTGRPADARS